MYTLAKFINLSLIYCRIADESFNRLMQIVLGISGLPPTLAYKQWRVFEIESVHRYQAFNEDMYLNLHWTPPLIICIVVGCCIQWTFFVNHSRISSNFISPFAALRTNRYFSSMSASRVSPFSTRISFIKTYAVRLFPSIKG